MWSEEGRSVASDLEEGRLRLPGRGCKEVGCAFSGPGFGLEEAGGAKSIQSFDLGVKQVVCALVLEGRSLAFGSEGRRQRVHRAEVDNCLATRQEERRQDGGRCGPGGAPGQDAVGGCRGEGRTASSSAWCGGSLRSRGKAAGGLWPRVQKAEGAGFSRIGWITV